MMATLKIPKSLGGNEKGKLNVIVTDSNNHVLTYGTDFQSIEDAIREAERAEHYRPMATLYAYIFTQEFKREPYMRLPVPVPVPVPDYRPGKRESASERDEADTRSY